MEKRDLVVAREGEYGFYFQLFLTHSNGSAYTTLVGDETITLWLHPSDPDDEAFSIGSGSVEDTATGEIRVMIGSGDNATLVEDKYFGQVEISRTDALLITNEIELLIRRRFGS